MTVSKTKHLEGRVIYIGTEIICTELIYSYFNGNESHSWARVTPEQESQYTPWVKKKLSHIFT